MTPWAKKYKLTREGVAQILEDFLEGGSNSPFSWDGFTLGMSFEDDYLEDVKIRSAGLTEEFPPDSPDEYCNERGRAVIREYINELRASSRLPNAGHS